VFWKPSKPASASALAGFLAREASSVRGFDVRLLARFKRFQKNLNGAAEHSTGAAQRLSATS